MATIQDIIYEIQFIKQLKEDESNVNDYGIDFGYFKCRKTD